MFIRCIRLEMALYIADGETRINNDGRNIKLNISNIIKVSTTANAIKKPNGWSDDNVLCR